MGKIFVNKKKITYCIVITAIMMLMAIMFLAMPKTVSDSAFAEEEVGIDKI